MTRFSANRDYYAGALMALIGAGAIYEGQQYGIGSLSQMGSGFFPVAMGVGLVVMGAVIALVRKPGPEGRGANEHGSAAHEAGAPDWRGALAITAGVVAFVALAKPAGLAPAIFACVFASALGAGTTTLKQAGLLALGVTVFGVLLFSYGLHVQFPVLRGVL